MKGVVNQLNRFDVERLRDKTAVGAAHFWGLVFGVWVKMQDICKRRSMICRSFGEDLWFLQKKVNICGCFGEHAIPKQVGKYLWKACWIRKISRKMRNICKRRSIFHKIFGRWGMQQLQLTYLPEAAAEEARDPFSHFLLYLAKVWLHRIALQNTAPPFYVQYFILQCCTHSSILQIFFSC